MKLESQIKKRILAHPQEAVVYHPRGFGEECISEIREILASPAVPEKFKPFVEAGDAGIIVRAGYRSLLELALRTRTARDVLWVLEQGRAASVKEISKRAMKIPWEMILPEGADVSVRCSLKRSRFKHEGMLEQVVLAELTSRGYSPAASTNRYLLDVRLDENSLRFALSTGGRPLYERGFKTALRGIATIKEDLAACLIRRSLARAGTETAPEHVFVPFAGSGTLGFETALAVLPLSASVFPRPFAILNFPCTPEASVRHLEKALRTRSRDARMQITFWDSVADAVEATEENARAFTKLVPGNVEIQTERRDFFKDAWPKGPLYLPLNPPFGERLSAGSSPVKLYSLIGRTIEERSARRTDTLSGFVLAPDLRSDQALAKQLTSFESEGINILHGGRSIRVRFFKRR